MTRLSDAPDSVIHAGVDYANDEWEDTNIITVRENGGRIVVEWQERDLPNPTEVSTEDMNAEKGGIESKEVEGSGEAFRKELERRK
ncbi:hypothetical protein PNP85_12600 [Halobacterium salinarum]|uniref:hypothetical protein n=1 Tax=Halobacterium salinarum TaxID=2242 RepID=UPI002554427D|nr:hypothetical protein [Halobacterium salinarum]MDL0140343.1 hypothetical protein [Halobacterium salinarum]